MSKYALVYAAEVELAKGGLAPSSNIAKLRGMPVQEDIDPPKILMNSKPSDLLSRELREPQSLELPQLRGPNRLRREPRPSLVLRQEGNDRDADIEFVMGL